MEDHVEPRWRKSSRSGNGGANCVEVAARQHGIAVRDSKNPYGPVVTLSREEWVSFTTRLRDRWTAQEGPS